MNIIKKKRYKEIDIARGIGAIAVVFFHSSSNGLPLIPYLQKILDGFQMPLFFFLSGFVSLKIFRIDSIQSYKIFIRAKAHRLITPYFILGMLVFLPKLVMNQYAKTKLMPSRFLSDLFLRGINPIVLLWFIYVLFLIFVIYTWFIKKNIKLTLILNFILYFLMKATGVSISILNLSSVIYFANYFVLGLMIRSYYDNIPNNTNKNKLILFALSGLIILLLGLQFSSQHFLMESIKGLGGIIFILSLSTLIKNNEIGSSLAKIGNYSYDIYLLAWFGQVAARIIVGQILGLPEVFVFISMLLGGLIVGVISKYTLRKIDLTNKYILGN